MLISWAPGRSRLAPRQNAARARRSQGALLRILGQDGPFMAKYEVTFILSPSSICGHSEQFRKPALSQSLKAGFADPFWPFVSTGRRGFLRQIRQVLGITKESSIPFPAWRQFAEQFENSTSELAVILSVESQGFNQCDPIRVPWADVALVVHFDARAVGDLTGVGSEVRRFGMIASAAGVNQIVIIQSAFGMNGLGNKVVNLPVFPQGQPRFPAQAVNTPKGEFIPEPISV